MAMCQREGGRQTDIQTDRYRIQNGDVSERERQTDRHTDRQRQKLHEMVACEEET